MAHLAGVDWAWPRACRGRVRALPDRRSGCSSRVALSLGEKHIRPAFDALGQTPDGDESIALQLLGEEFLTYTSQPDAVSIQRMVIAESGHTSIGQLFYEAGPKMGHDAIAFLGVVNSTRCKEVCGACPRIPAQALFTHWAKLDLKRFASPWK